MCACQVGARVSTCRHRRGHRRFLPQGACPARRGNGVEMLPVFSLSPAAERGRLRRLSRSMCVPTGSPPRRGFQRTPWTWSTPLPLLFFLASACPSIDMLPVQCYGIKPPRLPFSSYPRLFPLHRGSETPLLSLSPFQ
jgi:hypothetical protein